MIVDKQERRARGVNRVPVARLVDICGRDTTVPAFEAESIELSGRGMHVRTPYLPPLGAPLVCRLEDNGREIVVEGTVAWQRNCDGGGEFGVQFTALDSGSVEALKTLCGLTDDGADDDEKKAPLVPEPSVEPALAGMAVKLHIDGLGAPMKARVRKGGSRRVQVGSNLEFLKVGRGLQVEDVGQGQRRGARIDAVSIAIDPQTQVPQLVVALRYEGEDTTPEPSVIGDEIAEAAPPAPQDRVAARVESKPAKTEAQADAVESDDEDDDEDDEASAMRGPVDAIAVSIGRATQATGEKLAVAGSSAAALFVRFAKAGGAKLGEVAARRGSTPKRRATSPAPQAPAPSAQRRLRPQNGERDDPNEGKSRRRKVIAVAVLGVVGVAVAAMTLNRHPSKTASSDSVAAQNIAAEPAATALPAAQAPVAQNAGTPMGQPQAVAPGAVAGALPGGPASRPGVVANVPLFGPTTMATLEPAPLGPSPDEIGASSVSPAPHATEERMDDEDEPHASAHDEVFDDASPKKSSSDADSAEAKAEAVKPWGTGKLHLPVVHRIKLDRPGIALEGKKEMGGFSVELPGRRVVDGGSSIPKRDDRIAEVRTKNGPTGARVTFVFRSKIPTYKVRLRKNYVEFFISSPDNVK
ncbi:MAG TPA: PilZ domain-containing protein [Polyangiaceae bacterium]|jgi:hypothetical protein|nr:PilZ domain-containing protein [Polyangiaceae bacterium]